MNGTPQPVETPLKGPVRRSDHVLILVLRQCLKKFDSLLIYCPDFGVRFKTSEIRTLQNV